QQWHLHDETHPRFDPALRQAAGGDPLLQVYREIDASLGRLIAAAPERASLLVHLSHGMAAHHDGTHLLDEVLRRLDRAGRGGAASPLRQALKPAFPHLQQWAERWRVPAAVRTRLAQALRGDGPRDRARRRFFAAPNNSVYAGIRLNIIGREAQGKVRRDEAEALMDRIEADLLELVNLDTCGPVVRAVHRSHLHHSRSHDDHMPDLFIEWERTAPIERVYSAKAGTVHTPYTHWRTGDHRPDGLLIAVGPGFEAAREYPPIEVEDLGPSIAAHLGVPIADVDGAVVPWLASRGSAPALWTAEAPREAGPAHRASCG
ncbi:MAG TPA: hypothetical protein VGX37_13030, partial [Allosphingosinicella sp.]|nr:hypothetical protein [Allosphingosinicella sp.]